MTKTEERIIRLAMSYIDIVKDKDLYWSDKEVYLNVTRSLLNTLLEENEDGRETDVCEDDR